MIILAIIPITICFKLFGSNMPEDFVPIFFLGKVVVYGIIFVMVFAMILLIVREDKKTIILNKEKKLWVNLKEFFLCLFMLLY